MTFTGGNRSGPSRRHPRSDADDEPRALARSLDAYLTTERLGSMRLLSEIAARWGELVGEEAAKHTKPRSIEGGELVVSVDHPSRVTELAFLAPTICERLADQVGYRAIERVKGRVDSSFGVD